MVRHPNSPTPHCSDADGFCIFLFVYYHDYPKYGPVYYSFITFLLPICNLHVHHLYINHVYTRGPCIIPYVILMLPVYYLGYLNLYCTCSILALSMNYPCTYYLVYWLYITSVLLIVLPRFEDDVGVGVLGYFTPPPPA